MLPSRMLKVHIFYKITVIVCCLFSLSLEKRKSLPLSFLRLLLHVSVCFFFGSLSSISLQFQFSSFVCVYLFLHTFSFAIRRTTCFCFSFISPSLVNKINSTNSVWVFCLSSLLLINCFNLLS